MKPRDSKSTCWSRKAATCGTRAGSFAMGEGTNQRRFLAAAARAVGLPWTVAAAPRGARIGPGLLTVTGAIAQRNCGPLDPASDPLMIQHGANFDRAWEFDVATLARLPNVTFQPTLDYDAKVHTLSGPLLSSVVEAAGVIE